MSEDRVYSTRVVFDELRKKFHQYLEAQYHIWDEGLIEERSLLLCAEGVTFQEPRLEATPFYVAGQSYDKLHIPLAAREILNLASTVRSTGIPEVPYLHQAEALELFLGEKREIIVATGTGSGKTESFLMPIVGSLAIESSQRPGSWDRPGCRAILLYPMNALVNDQLSRLRRLLGDTSVAEMLRGNRLGRTTFGMYTSRTPYPGVRKKASDKQRLEEYIQNAFLSLPLDIQEKLRIEGKWPSKDLQHFIDSNYQTGLHDAEMLARQEMQKACPDLLITNYSMLEYMLLRPIEKSIFEQTASWLASDSENIFTVVLDEAHMYRGSGGAEVAYLLRRLRARLGISRDRMRFILTSASLGKSAEAEQRMKAFAANLSGLAEGGKAFILIRGKQLEKSDARIASDKETSVLAEFNFTALHNSAIDLKGATEAFRSFAKSMGSGTTHAVITTQVDLQDEIYQWLSSFGPAAMVANLLTTRPQKAAEIVSKVFAEKVGGNNAIEALMALMSFAAERDTGRVFSPTRSHIFFRGLAGVYACIDPDCSAKKTSGKGVLGKVYSAPMIKCECGSRVYEVLTHRDCGAAFVRGYVADQHQGDFLWHQPSAGLRSSGGMLEAHLLVEVKRRAGARKGKNEGSSVWLQKATGKLVAVPPSRATEAQFVELLRPNGLIQVRGGIVLSFDCECPVCTRRWRSGSTKIMDLATKGEAPFAQLIRTQVELQPKPIPVTDRSPNGGRKSLLFSDGRQKAARLARDIPREIENDVFRQLLLMASVELSNINREPTIGLNIYAALVHVLAKNSLLLFDGNDREWLRRDVGEHRKYHHSDLEDALNELPSAIPPSVSSLLLRNFGSDFYSVSALTLGYLAPAKKPMKAIINALPMIDKSDLVRLCISWTQAFASEFAINPDLARGVRFQAAGYPVTSGPDKEAGLSAGQLAFLRNRISNLDAVLEVIAGNLAQKSPHGDSGLFLIPNRLVLRSASDGENWYQCSSCASVSPVDWWGSCPNCLAPNTLEVRPGATKYLRARKSFFRDPVVEVMEGRRTPFNLSVEEHTAQLSYKDVGDSTTTTEEFERRFRDILINTDETSIDVLSCTTTMEVGIDIGSLVGVGLRNVPPLRQNYQQRAGRAGRRGSAISTVITYAQNSPHDSHYFSNPEPIISGEPTLPGIDIDNPKIIERHIRAQLIQAFFHSKNPASANSDIFSVLGETMAFYSGDGECSFKSFIQWLSNSADSDATYDSIHKWLPNSFARSPQTVATEFVDQLEEQKPGSIDELDPAEESFIEFLFVRGFLPAYAFPRDLCALQIEMIERQGNYSKVKIIERPQQGLSVALSEYAPGRLVVVNKKTYRIGTVTASGSVSVVDRADRLFQEQRSYAHCVECQYTPGFTTAHSDGGECPVCGKAALKVMPVIEPQVVYPEGGREIDEFDDDQTFSSATSAQLSVPEGGGAFDLTKIGANAEMAFARNQQLVMVNMGEEQAGLHSGFLVCKRCGKTATSRPIGGAHERDYKLVKGANIRCTGDFVPVYLGYGFSSDVLLFRLPLLSKLKFDPLERTAREPIADALRSLSEAIVLGTAQNLDIDIREISAGFRFFQLAGRHCSDIFLFDNLAGGAGYATQAGEHFIEVLAQVEKVLKECKCSSSCDKCLRHYGNRLFHSQLDRHLALSLLYFFRDNVVPPCPSKAEQEEVLDPLRVMLELAGWTTISNSKSGLGATKSGRTISVMSLPSLFDPAIYGFAEKTDCYNFSPYELARDLPGVFREIN